MEMLIGELAKSSGVGTETIRYYERRGLLARPRRSGSNYRRFDETDAARLRFIRRAKELGFTLSEIKALLTLKINKESRRSDVKSKVLAKVQEITDRISDLARIKNVLESLACACDGTGSIDGCPILEALEKPSISTSKLRRTKS